MANKLDMTLDALIKTSRSKPAAAAGAKKAGGAKPGGGKAGGGAAGSKQLKKPQQKAQQKGKQQQQQQQGKKPQQKPGIKARAAGGGKQIKAGLQVKGGVSKASGGKAQQRPGVQQRGRQPDVRVVPRPGVARPAQQHPRGGALHHGGGYMQPVAGGHYMAAAPMMMAPQMMGGPAGGHQQRAAPSDRDLFDGTLVSSNTSSKLLVSNLDHKVTDEDIRELFGTVGPIKESGVHYDRNGRSAGTAYVVFERRADALAAFNRYNNVALDNKKMAIEVVEQAVPRGTFKTLASGINVSRAQQAAAAAGIRGRGLPHDYMQE